MTTPQIIKLVLLISVVIGLLIYKQFKGKKNSTLNEETPKSKKIFYSIYEGNQTKINFAPTYDKAWFDNLDKKYSWEKFGLYDNRYFEYMYILFDTLPALS